MKPLIYFVHTVAIKKASSKCDRLPSSVGCAEKVYQHRIHNVDEQHERIMDELGKRFVDIAVKQGACTLNTVCHAVVSDRI